MSKKIYAFRYVVVKHIDIGGAVFLEEYQIQLRLIHLIISFKSNIKTLFSTDTYSIAIIDKLE